MSTNHNVVVVTFNENSKAYEALSVLKRADAEERVAVLGAAVVERQSDGKIQAPEGADNIIGAGLAGGSLIGMLVGVLGGPLGLLLGWGVGALAGGLVDLGRASRGDDVLAQMGTAIPPGQTALVAEVKEYAVEVINDEMGSLGGTVVRRPAEEVLAELEASEQAARAAEKEARRVMRERRRAELERKRESLREQWDERLKSLKHKLYGDN
jgi:uncharacterized membrane protein